MSIISIFPMTIIIIIIIIIILEGYRLIVVRSARPNQPESYAGGSVTSC
jgi:hypothetical protein